MLQIGRVRLSEDWLATIIGLIVVLVIGVGALGPGGQEVKVASDAGATAAKPALATSGWAASATLGGEKTKVEGASSLLSAGETTVITCQDGVLTAEAAAALPEGVEAAPSGKAQVVVVNQCDAAVEVTYKTPAAIPWPIFKLFG